MRKKEIDQEKHQKQAEIQNRNLEYRHNPRFVKDQGGGTQTPKLTDSRLCTGTDPARNTRATDRPIVAARRTTSGPKSLQ
jgi:hypothetical protein